MHNNKSCRTKGISCSATAVTTGTTTSSSLEYAKPYSHLPDPSKIVALKIIDTTKNDAVVQPTVPPSNIVSSNLIGVADDVECYLPAQKSLKKTVRRRRRKDAVTLNPDLALADERSLLSLTIPAPLLEPWKFFDSGPGPDRVLILTTDANLDFLCESVRWCGDGTFKAAPKLWTQLYTIHGQKNGYTVPCVFALLPNKRKESYNLVFSKIKSWIDVVSQNWQFEAYLSDFEKGAFLAAVEVFPGIASEGCFFHLSKRLDYHVWV